jgi:putative ABC transport system substrate-binding protein
MNRLRRLVLVMSASALAAPFPSQGQGTRKVKIGVLSLGSPPPGLLEAFTRELGHLGYVEGRNLAVEWRFAEGSNDRLAAQARELAALKVDAIFAVSTPAALAAKQATSDIPVVIARVADPVQSGLVASLARPGGNITGLSSTFMDIGPKLLEFFKEAIPGSTRIAVMWNKRNHGSVLGAKLFEAASGKLGLQYYGLEVERPQDIHAAFQAAKLGGAAAMILLEDLFITSHKSDILNLGMKHALPVISFSRDFAEAGAIITYGPNIPDMYRRGAQYVDRILKGSKPGELPIEQPSRYELIVNLKAAKILGLTVPSSLLLRADSVIR